MPPGNIGASPAEAPELAAESLCTIFFVESEEAYKGNFQLTRQEPKSYAPVGREVQTRSSNGSKKGLEGSGKRD